MTRFAFTTTRRIAAVSASASLAVLLSTTVSHQAIAACTGSVASPNSATVTILCNGVGAGGAGTADNPVVVTPGTSIIDNTTTSTAGNNTLLQFDGHGRMLENSGSIINDRVITGTAGARGRTGITMGASTVNAGTGTSYLTPVYDAGTNTTTITISGAASSAYVGQSIVFGRYDAADADFFPASAYVITAVSGNTVTIAGQLPAGYSGTGSLPERYSIVSNFGATTVVDGVAYNDVIINSGVISTQIKASEVTGNATGTAPNQTSVSNTATVRTINTAVAGTYLVKNLQGGQILASHGGIGTVQAIFEGGQVLSMTIDNAGLIEATRVPLVTLASVTATGNPTGTIPGFSAQTIGSAWTIATEEEAEEVIIHNAATGVVRSKGDYTGTIYSRVEEATIVNYGLIEHVSGSGIANDYSKGFAIGQVSNGGGVRELEVENYGTIHGDILSVNGNAVRWYLLSTEGVVTTSGGVTTSDLAAGVDQRLLINSHTGQANSEIENKASGTIIGNFWYSNGTHELENEGTIVGNIDVDQRDTTYGTVSGSVVTVLEGSDENPGPSNNTVQGAGYVIRGDKTFEFENEGKFTGNLTIRNATSTITGGIYGSETINKTVSSDNKIENSGTFDGNIVIHDVAGAKNDITLSGDGFGRKADGTVGTNGNITAVNGTGNNILNLDGQGTLRGDVLKFTTLNLLAGEAGGDDDDDDDDDEHGSAGGNAWTLAAGKMFEFQQANIQGGTLNVLGHLFGATSIAEGGTLTGTGTVTGNVSNNGTIDVKDDTLHIVGNVTFHDESKLSTTISGSGNGLLDILGTSTFEEGSSVSAEVDGGRVRNGDSYKIVTASGGLIEIPEIEDTSALLKWTPIVDGNDLYITAEVDARNIAGISKPGAMAINALLGTDNELGDEVLLIEDEEDVRRAGNQLAPQTNFATQQAAITLNQTIGQHIDARLASVGATGSNGTFVQPSGLGMKQKDPNRSNLGGATPTIDESVPSGGGAMWGRAFGAGLDQGERENVDGYNARLYGILAGYDNWAAPGVRVGVAVGYANTTIDGDGFTKQNQTDIDSYLAELYGTYKGSGWYATGRTGYTWHDYDTRRVLTVPVGDVAKGSHDGSQYNAAIELGAPMRIGNGSVLTPVASLTYSHLDQDGYTETSSSGMALAINDQSNDSLVSGLGLKALVPIAHDTVLEARALWLHEFSDTAQFVTASFASGGGTFTAAGPGVGRDSAALGVGLLATIGAESTFQLNYDANVREDFVAHIGSAQLTVRY